MDNKVEAYQGVEKYAFISYSHKDSQTVYPIIKQLTDMGYRIWYDEGIPLVSDYGGVLYNRIKDCSVFIIFKSNDSVASRDVQLEITHAINFHKKIAQIVIDETAVYPPSVAYGIPASVQYLSINAPHDEFYKKLTAQLAECLDGKDNTNTQSVIPPTARAAQTHAAGSALLPMPRNVKEFLVQRKDDPEYNKMIRVINTCAILIYIFMGIMFLSVVWAAEQDPNNNLFYYLSNVVIFIQPIVIAAIWLHVRYSKAAAVISLLLSIALCVWFIVIMFKVYGIFVLNTDGLITVNMYLTSAIASAVAVLYTFRAASEFKKFKENAGKAE